MGRVRSDGARRAGSPRTLADDLRRRNDDDLLRLFELRPDLLDPIPANLSCLAAAAAATTSVMAALKGLDRPSLAVLARIAANPGSITLAALAELCGVTGGSTLTSVVGPLRDRALVWGDPLAGDDSVLHPTVAVRELARGFDRPGLIDLTRHSPRIAGRRKPAGSGQSLAVISGVEAVGAQCARRPPQLRKTGEYPAREIAELAARLSADSATVSYWAELARTAGLVRVTPDSRQQHATPELLHWLALEPPERWACLVLAWLSAPSSDHGSSGGATGEAGGSMRWADVGFIRRLTLMSWAEAGAGSVVDAEAFLELARDRAPRRESGAWPDLIAETLAGAERLGLAVGGALAPAALPLAHLDTKSSGTLAQDLACAVADALPEPVGHMLLQADFTAVIPGIPTAVLKAGLQRLGHSESTSGAWVFRLEPEAIAAAVAGGWPANEILDFLDRHSRSGVPQPIRYVVVDSQRRVSEGQVGVREQVEWTPGPDSDGEGRCVPLCLLGEQAISGNAETGRRASRRVILRSLRAADHRMHRPDEQEFSIPEAISDCDRPGPQAAVAALAVISDAISADQPALMCYSDRAGVSDIYLIDPLRISGGQLEAFDHGSGSIRCFVLSRVIGARPATQSEASNRRTVPLPMEKVDA